MGQSPSMYICATNSQPPCMIRTPKKGPEYPEIFPHSLRQLNNLILRICNVNARKGETSIGLSPSVDSHRFQFCILYQIAVDNMISSSRIFDCHVYALKIQACTISPRNPQKPLLDCIPLDSSSNGNWTTFAITQYPDKWRVVQSHAPRLLHSLPQRGENCTSHTNFGIPCTA